MQHKNRYDETMDSARKAVKEADETDRKILNILLDNSRLSLRKIAKKADISVATAMKRMQQMEKAGIIKKYSAVVDCEKLGYEVSAIIEVKLKKQFFGEVGDVFESEHNIIEAYDITGPSDMMLYTKFRSIDELNNFVKRLNKFPCILGTNTKIILQTLKEEKFKL